jgi:HD-like signal output (HDOD) protein
MKPLVAEFESVHPTPAQICREVRHLPSAPKVLPRLKRLLQDGNSSLREIAALIRLDQAIAARVLQVSNSLFYRKGLRCHTVDEAIQRVGFDQVHELVSYAVASQVLVRPLEVYGVEADEIWRQSVACALAAEAIAITCGDDCSLAYTVGLLHRLGMVVINEWALRQQHELRLFGQEFPSEFVRSERMLLGCTQADVGAALLTEWDFSPDMTEPVRWQYVPGAAVHSVRFASLLYAARWVRTVVCDEGPPPALPPAELLEPLSLAPARLVTIATEVRQQLQTISILLAESSRRPDRAIFVA